MYKLGEALNSFCKKGKFLFRAYIEPLRVPAYRKYITELIYIDGKEQKTLCGVSEVVNTSEFDFEQKAPAIWNRLDIQVCAKTVSMLRNGELEEYLNG